MEWEDHEKKGLQNIFEVKTNAKLTDRELSMHEALGLTASTDRKRKGVKEWAVWVIEFRLGGERLKRY